MSETSPPRQARWTFHAAWIGLAVGALIAAFGVVVVRGEAIRSQREDLARQESRGQPVLVTPLIRIPQTREILLPGEIYGYYETPIYAKIAGYVKTMLVDKGSRVRAGELVATIESPETDQQTRNAKAAYEIAALTDRRYQSLIKQQVVPQQVAAPAGRGRAGQQPDRERLPRHQRLDRREVLLGQRLGRPVLGLERVHDGRHERRHLVEVHVQRDRIKAAGVRIELDRDHLGRRVCAVGSVVGVGIARDERDRVRAGLRRVSDGRSSPVPRARCRGQAPLRDRREAGQEDAACSTAPRDARNAREGRERQRDLVRG